MCGLQTRIREHLTYTNVTATLALFVALGGTGAYAAAKIGAGDIKKGAVRSKHIKDGTIKTVELSKTARSAFKGNRGPAGDRGPTGTNGSRGPAGPAGPAGPSAFLAGSENELPSCGDCEVSLAVSGMSSFGALGNRSNEQLSPNATIVGRDLSVAVEVAPGSGTRTFGLYPIPFQSGVALICSISGTAKTCNSASQTVTIPAGSRLIMDAVNHGSAPPSRVTFGWRATSP